MPARGGAAVLYSTHQMEEADRLCHRVVLLDRGRVVAAGTPGTLAAGAGMTPRLHLRTARPLPDGWLPERSEAHVMASDGSDVTLTLRETREVPVVLAAALRAGGEVLEMTLQRPSLADVFIALTGRALRDDEWPGAA